MEITSKSPVQSDGGCIDLVRMVHIHETCMFCQISILAMACLFT